MNASLIVGVIWSVMFPPIQFAVPGGIAQNMLIVLYIVAAVLAVMIAGAAQLSQAE